ncbi:divalent-cation tolerance protein CutA [Candidatus Fermentibacterales bacterium]|nr:divalent-cation tolerance protein CutA [Candidatus Fermentibacterales bacterium]
MTPSRLVQVVTTLPGDSNARDIAEVLVAGGLAACAQIDGPITSIYRWKGELSSGREWRLVLKTPGSHAGRLRARLLELHPYEVPEMIQSDIDLVHDEYAEWAEGGGAGRD